MARARCAVRALLEFGANPFISNSRSISAGGLLASTNTFTDILVQHGFIVNDESHSQVPKYENEIAELDITNEDTAWSAMMNSIDGALSVFEDFPEEFEVSDSADFTVEYHSQAQAELICERVNKLVSVNLLPPYESVVDVPVKNQLIYFLDSKEHVPLYNKRRPVLTQDNDPK